MDTATWSEAAVNPFVIDRDWCVDTPLEAMRRAELPADLITACSVQIDLPDMAVPFSLHLIHGKHPVTECLVLTMAISRQQAEVTAESLSEAIIWELPINLKWLRELRKVPAVLSSQIPIDAE